jgi:hypothetical protein
VTTIDARVAASADDGNELSSGNVQITTSSFLVDQVNEWGAFRVAVTIPDGATIDVAYLTLQFDSGTLDEPDLTIYGEDTATPAAYSAGTATFTISSRSRTSASVDWGSTDLGAPGAFNSPSIVSIIEELMASYSYASGAYMAFMWTSRANDSARDAQVVFYDGNSSQAPLLHIEYTEAGGSAQNVNANAIASTATVYQPAITVGAVTVSLSTIASGATVYQPSVTAGAVTVSLNAIGSTGVVYELAVTQGSTITPNAIASAAQVYQPSITVGAVTVNPNAIVSGATVYAPLVQIVAGQTVNLNTIASGSIVYQIIVSLFTISAERIYTVEAEDRIFVVAFEDRIFSVESENRTYTTS